MTRPSATATCRPSLDWIGEALLAGDYDPILDLYAERVAVFMSGATHLVRSREEMRAALAQHREVAKGEGTRAITCTVAAVGLPMGPRRRMFVDWTYDLGPRRRPRRSSAIYYVADRGAGPRIEMIHYRTLAFPRPDRQRARSGARTSPVAATGGGS